MKNTIQQLILTAFLLILSCNIQAQALQVGQSYGGGIIALIDAKAQHGLIADKTIVSAMRHALAKAECINSIEGGFEDWRLPTSAELKILLELNVSGPKNWVPLKNNSFYWTSEKSNLQGTAYYAYKINDTGIIGGAFFYDMKYYVCAVRSF